MKLKQAFVLATTVASLSLGSLAHATSNYPNQPIRVIVPFAPGGSTDIVARIVVQEMSKILGQSMVIENKAGAGGAIGAAEAARAKPDGYTLSLATVSTMAVNPACRPNDLPYDPQKDFAPVSNFVNTPNVIVVNPGVPANNFAEFVQVLKDNPGKYTYASPGICSIGNLNGEAFKQAVGVDLVHVPYKGSGPAVADTLGGQVHSLFDNLPSSMPHIQTGKLKAMAVAWPERMKDIPDVPTYAEMGYPQLNNGVFYGLLAPAGTPPEIIEKLNKATQDALKEPKIIAALEKQGAFPAGNTPEEFAQQIKDNYDLAKSVVEKSQLEMK
ncbi:tripartite tricarboxylate transporter substrate binding protein BugE [Advenella alkanexedens]|jgi:tripartite-type tricarboxylate transporter receptor subunit TctC|uniref:Tripartite tricarboxylate transporter substrate binding protein BugE n=1 Tax=Advenella alkanexedens TaxID=1481665 RepID=A0ABS6NNS8_9BURK|nr:tripartite tricarboxylate transporter substrate binding protein BugE [Advenella alkanexedens]MBV4397288.1 tripartite tricarboxylate transporter substrate binding protein BugE [Advenella alkanexedens]NLN67221.1 tripartite tricarboxylate transporter substrate binding protein BugE [Alcaligenaceae bacterium]